ncbi:MAG: XTP/dITP diphosphatase [Desulfatirhabdiaceae bacterium]
MGTQTIVVATRNPGKLKEIQSLLNDFPVILKSLDDFGPIPEVEEDGETFDENAYKKASFTSRILGIPAIADDSGLVVNSLDGEPGIHSARYGGDHLTDMDRCMILLKNMEHQSNRQAQFECVISIAVPTGAALTYEARCDGLILDKPKGENGFGYDPVFYYPPLQKTFAEMSPDEKNEISHRAKAFLEIKNEFDKILIWISHQMPIFDRVTCQEDSHA